MTYLVPLGVIRAGLATGLQQSARLLSVLRTGEIEATHYRRIEKTVFGNVSQALSFFQRIGTSEHPAILGMLQSTTTQDEVARLVQQATLPAHPSAPFDPAEFVSSEFDQLNLLIGGLVLGIPPDRSAPLLGHRDDYFGKEKLWTEIFPDVGALYTYCHDTLVKIYAETCSVGFWKVGPREGAAALLVANGSDERSIGKHHGQPVSHILDERFGQEGRITKGEPHEHWTWKFKTTLSTLVRQVGLGRTGLGSSAEPSEFAEGHVETEHPRRDLSLALTSNGALTVEVRSGPPVTIDFFLNMFDENERTLPEDLDGLIFQVTVRDPSGDQKFALVASRGRFHVHEES